MKLLVTAVLTLALAAPVAAQDSFPVAREIAVLKADVETLKRRVADLERLVLPTAPGPKAVLPPATVAAPPVTTFTFGATTTGNACANGNCPAPAARFAPVRGFFGRVRN